MSKITRRQMIRAGVAGGAALTAGTANAAPEEEKQSPFEELFLAAQLTKERISAANGVAFTKHEYTGVTFWVGGHLVACVSDIAYDSPRIPHRRERFIERRRVCEGER